MDILDDMGVSKLSVKVFFLFCLFVFFVDYSFNSLPVIDLNFRHLGDKASTQMMAFRVFTVIW